MSDGYYKDLFEAAAKNNENVIKYLVEEKCVSLKHTNQEDSTAAHIATTHGFLNIIKYILARDSSLVTATDYSGNTILFLAIQNGHPDIVKYLVEYHKVDISKRNDLIYGCTAIHIAAQYGQLDILRYFIEEKNGNVNILNALEQPPIFLAAINKHQCIVKYLVEKKNASLAIVDHRRHNILYISVNENDMILMKYILDERKVKFDFNWRDIHGITLVHRAALLDHLDLLIYLVSEKHADVNIPDYTNKTPLHSAARRNLFRICKYLVDHGADIQFKDEHGKLAVEEASSKRVIRLLESVSNRRSRRSMCISRPTKSTSIFDVIGGSSIESLTSLDENMSSPFLNINSFQFQNFLVIAKMIVIKIKGFKCRGNVVHEALLSPQEIVRSQADPVAINVVNNSENFKNFYIN